MDPRKQSLLGKALLLSWAYLYLLIDQWIPWIKEWGLIPYSILQGGPGFLQERPFWITRMLGVGFNTLDSFFTAMVSVGPIYLLPVAILFWFLIVCGPTVLCIWYTVKIWRQWKVLPERAGSTTDLKGGEK